MRFLHSLIIPYQELLGNYDSLAFQGVHHFIIPYQELLGNYDWHKKVIAKIPNYTIPRAIREL